MKQTPLHLSQKIFWFTASACLFLGTVVFSLHVIRGRAAAIEILGIKFSAERAESSVVEARDRLLTIRTTLADAFSRNDIQAVTEALPDLDAVLKSLGVAQSALKRQQAQVKTFSDSTASYDNYYKTNDSGMIDDQGFNWGGSEAKKKSPSPTATKRRK